MRSPEGWEKQVKLCSECKFYSAVDHAMTNDCKHERIAHFYFLVRGKIGQGARMDAYLVRMNESLCGSDGAWWEALVP